jgi:triacylglycerol lipase
MTFKEYTKKLFTDFEAFPKHYSAVNTAALAVCADLVYEEWVVVEKVVKSLGFDYFKFADVKGTQSFTIADEKKIIIAFRGSEVTEFGDVMTDLDTSLEPYYYPNRNKYYGLIDDYETARIEGGRGKIHQGFKEALDLIWTIVYRQVCECREEDVKMQRYRPIWICGHSLGGALANLATARFWEHGIDEIHGTCTFGQPRVGNKDFAEWFNLISKGRYYRIVNNNDIVARVPFYNGYTHTGKMRYFDANGNLREEKLSALEMFWDRMKSGFFTDLGGDHSMKNYIKITASALGHKDLLI